MVIWYDSWYMILWYIIYNYIMVYGIWYMIYGIWYMIYDIRHMTYDIWYTVYGIRYTVRYTVYSTWYVHMPHAACLHMPQWFELRYTEIWYMSHVSHMNNNDHYHSHYQSEWLTIKGSRTKRSVGWYIWANWMWSLGPGCIINTYGL